MSQIRDLAARENGGVNRAEKAANYPELKIIAKLATRGRGRS